MLHLLPKLTTRKIKRLGRGIGSGVGGHTVGKGTKGHTSRQNGTTALWFEGGQLPLIKRLPYWRGKFRFKALEAKEQVVRTTSLVKIAGKDVTPETLKTAGLIRSQYLAVKIVGKAESLPKFGEIRGVALSEGARLSLEKVATISA